jgi:hypothetical protein
LQRAIITSNEIEAGITFHRTVEFPVVLPMNTVKEKDYALELQETRGFENKVKVIHVGGFQCVRMSLLQASLIDGMNVINSMEEDVRERISQDCNIRIGEQNIIA